MIRRLAPSVLNADLAQLADQVRLVEEAADWIHLDLMDGHFVPNLSFGPPVVAALRPHTAHYLDCHLMVANPEALLPALAEAGAGGVTMHVEALDDPRRAVRAAADLGMAPGLALRPGTPLQAVLPHLDAVDLVHTLIYDQCIKGQGYPVALARAHEQAIVRAADRRAFLSMVEGSLLRAELPATDSRKRESKERQGV